MTARRTRAVIPRRVPSTSTARETKSAYVWRASHFACEEVVPLLAAWIPQVECSVALEEPAGQRLLINLLGRSMQLSPDAGTIELAARQHLRCRRGQRRFRCRGLAPCCVLLVDAS